MYVDTDTAIFSMTIAHFYLIITFHVIVIEVIKRVLTLTSANRILIISMYDRFPSIRYENNNKMA